MSSATVRLRGLAESIIVTRLDELSIKAIMGNGKRAFHSGEVDAVIDGVHKETDRLDIGSLGNFGEYLFSAHYRPSKIFSYGTTIEMHPPLYISTVGSLLYYLIGSITQVGGQTFPRIAFGNYLRQNLGRCLSYISFKELLKTYGNHIRPHSFGVTNDATRHIDELENAFRVLRGYKQFITPDHIQNLVLLHDHILNPVTRLDVTGSTATSKKEDGAQKSSLDKSPTGYNVCDFTMNGYVNFEPALAVEMMELEGEFKLKLRKGMARRITKRIDSTYKLKGDWEGNVKGRANIRIGALAYWRGNNVSRPEIGVNFEGVLL